MWRLFAILAAVFAVISAPRVADGEWVLLPIGGAFAATLTIIGAGVSSAVAAWPSLTPRLLLVDAALTVAALVVGALMVRQPVQFIVPACAVCGASMVVVLGVALAGWLYRLR
jgi:hypothetical protein